MRNKRLLGIIAFTLAASLAAAAPWASIAYAEGTSFMLVRDGKTSTYSVDSAAVFGMELRRGDILQTASSTFLEIYVTSVKASVQVAENTSFKCDSDSTGEQVTGELYYGRVRAKVAKLAGASSFRITTPTLVAGVRGTDFGCDVIAVRPSASSAGAAAPAASTTAASSASAPTLNRVFCFEGTVTVALSPEAAEAARKAQKGASSSIEPVLISQNEMVETVVASGGGTSTVLPATSGGVAAGTTAVGAALSKTAISGEVSSFWLPRPFAEVAPAFPEGRIEESPRRNLKIPAGASTALIVFGTAACCGASWYSEHVDADAVFVAPAYSAGIVMVGTGSVLALVSAIFD